MKVFSPCCANREGAALNQTGRDFHNTGDTTEKTLLLVAVNLSERQHLHQDPHCLHSASQYILQVHGGQTFTTKGAAILGCHPQPKGTKAEIIGGDMKVSPPITSGFLVPERATEGGRRSRQRRRGGFSPCCATLAFQ